MGLLSHLSNPGVAIIFAVALFFALTVREFFHAFVAHLCGDDTAKAMGRMTMNPLAHLSLAGTLVMLFLPFGWAKPVPIVPRNFRNPKIDSLLVSGAGISANILTAFSFGILARFIGWENMNYGAMELVFYFMLINLGFAFFNLLPIPPLDGSKILAFFLPSSIAHKIEYMGPVAQIVCIGVIYAIFYLIPLASQILSAIINYFFYAFSGGDLLVINKIVGG